MVRYEYQPLQNVPLWLTGQEQTKPPSSALQLPPCWQGLDKQLSTAEDVKKKEKWLGLDYIILPWKASSKVMKGGNRAAFEWLFFAFCLFLCIYFSCYSIRLFIS